MPRNQVIGILSNLFIPISNFEVTPVIAYYDKQPNFNLSKEEVQRVFNCNIQALLNPSTLKSKIMNLRDVDVEIPYYDIDNEVVWGATAMILTEFLDIIRL